MVAFHADVHSLLVLTLLTGSVRPKLISVCPTRPILSLTGLTWWSELRTTSRSTGLPLIICSHSPMGNPRGAIWEVDIHCLTMLKSFRKVVSFCWILHHHLLRQCPRPLIHCHFAFAFLYQDWGTRWMCTLHPR